MSRLTEPIPETIYIELEKDAAYKLSEVLHKIIGTDNFEKVLSLEEYCTVSEFSHILTRKLTIGD